MITPSKESPSAIARENWFISAHEANWSTFHGYRISRITAGPTGHEWTQLMRLEEELSLGDRCRPRSGGDR
jgi:hypothetical protein